MRQTDHRTEPWQPTPAQARALRRIRRAVHHAAKLGTYPPLVAYAVLDGQTDYAAHVSDQGRGRRAT